MKIILKEGSKYVLRLDKDEEAIGEIKKFCKKQGIKSGFFWGLGAASTVLLSAYDLDRREYFDSRIEEGLEISSFFGNIAMSEGKMFVHAHGVFGDFDTRAHAGHVKELIVAATCEIFLEKMAGKITRKYSKKIGLNVME